MSHRRWAAVTAVLALLGVLAIVAVQMFSPPREAALGGYTGHRASPSAVPSGTVSSSGATGSSAAEDAGSSARPSAPPSNVVPSSRPTWDPVGEETRPKVPGGVGTKPYRLPSVTPPRPALTKVPPAAHAKGRLAAGFPEHVVPVQRGAAVRSSSVAPQGQRVLVGLETRSDKSSEAVLEFYAEHCGGLGWPVTQGSAPDGAPQLRCALGRDSLTVTARSVPTGTTMVTAAGAFEVR